MQERKTHQRVFFLFIHPTPLCPLLSTLEMRGYTSKQNKRKIYYPSRNFPKRCAARPPPPSVAVEQLSRFRYSFPGRSEKLHTKSEQAVARFTGENLFPLRMNNSSLTGVTAATSARQGSGRVPLACQMSADPRSVSVCVSTAKPSV